MKMKRLFRRYFEKVAQLSLIRFRQAQQSSTIDQSPETYLGHDRAKNYGGSKVLTDAETTYRFSMGYGPNQSALGGLWTIGAQDDKAGEGAKLGYNFTAKQVYLVMGSDSPRKVKVLINGKPAADSGIGGSDVGSDSYAKIDGSRLHRLVKSEKLLRGAVIELQFEAGITANAFTFDS